MFSFIRRWRRKTYDWLNGTNYCPRCGNISYKVTFGIFHNLCYDCVTEETKQYIKLRFRIVKFGL